MIVSGQSILHDLGVDVGDPGELEYVIGRGFSSWGGDLKDSKALLFPGDQEHYAIKLVFDAKHRLVDALAGPALDEAKLTEVRARIATAFQSTEELKIGTLILFAPLPVTGAFRHREDFQILPVPDEAPRPTYLEADHPFLLQFSYVGSADPFVDSRRQGLRGAEIELLLAGLVSAHIHANRDQRARWVLPREPDGGWQAGAQELKSVLRQGCYIYPGMKHALGEFAGLEDCEPLRLVPVSEFHGRLGIEPGQVLDLPANFEQAVSAYHRLEASQKLRFGNACYWLQHSAHIRVVSSSASYLALALAIECLMPSSKAGAVCETCQRTIGKGPTRQFREFVEQFAPGTGSFGSESKAVQRLYEIRSKLVHGGGLLITDREQLLAPSLASFEDWQNEDRLQRIVRVALINWLGERSVAP